jgi:hypothetical protein
VAQEPDSSENQLRARLRENGSDTTNVVISRIEIANSDWDISKVYLHSEAHHGPTHGVGVYLGISFSTPVTLNFPSYGHIAHFGLGRFEPFVPVIETERTAGRGLPKSLIDKRQGRPARQLAVQDPFRIESDYWPS